MTPLEALEATGTVHKAVGATTPFAVHIDADCARLAAAPETTAIEHRGALPLSARVCPFCDPDAEVASGRQGGVRADD